MGSHRDRILGAIDSAVAELACMGGPVSLSEEYLRAVEWVERLERNQSGSDKSWLWVSVARDRAHFARARRC